MSLKGLSSIGMDYQEGDKVTTPGGVREMTGHGILWSDVAGKLVIGQMLGSVLETFASLNVSMLL